MRLRSESLTYLFMALLSAMGFYDIHYTHGNVEFGKDFIAKRLENEVEIQFSFQTKAGDIPLAEWRNNVMGQLFEALNVGLSRPCFSKDLPHRVVLVLTGRLTGNVALGLQELNDKIQNALHLLPIQVWDHETLLGYLEVYGLEGLYNTTAAGFVNYGNFYVLYGKSIQDSITEREIESHSRQWINDGIDPKKRLLGAAIESEIIAQKLTNRGYVYEAIHAHLGALRAVVYQLQTETQPMEIEWLLELYQQSKVRLRVSCQLYMCEIRAKWATAGKDLVRLIPGAGSMITYLVHCARIIEVTGMLYFLETEDESKSDVATFLQDFAEHEKGIAHLPSDRYAVSLVLPALALYDSGRCDLASELIRRATVWLCDRYQEGFGIASFEASERVQVLTLLAYPFSFINIESRHTSFAASAVTDLAAFIDQQLYADVVNDIGASEIVRQYWQVQDTVGLFRIEGEDVISYPNIEYADTMTLFDAFEFAEHIKSEPRTFRTVQIADPFALMAIMLLLRDRYFPTIWPQLVPN